MEVDATSRGDRRAVGLGKRALVPLGVTGVLYGTRVTDVSAVDVACALLLASMPWAAYVRWRRGGRSLLPLFALVAGIYWLYFAVPLFWGDRLSPALYGPRYVSSDSVTSAMLMAALGVCSLWVGRNLPMGRRVRIPELVRLSPSPGAWNYLRLLFAATTAFSLAESAPAAAGSSLRQLVIDLQSAIPLALFIILLRGILRGRRAPVDILLVTGYVVVTFITGLSSGWLGAWFMTALAFVLVVLAERKRFPILPIVLLLPYVLFFQAGKQEYRQAYWNQGMQSSRLDRVAAWVDASAGAWGGALGGASGRGVLDLVRPMIMRTSLLTASAHVIAMTPGEVPFQYGSLYGYVAAGLVPRVLWPEKPSQNEANQFVQVAYGFTSPRDLARVSIAVGSLTEAYINFGWIGVIVVMVTLGTLLSWVESSFLNPDVGVLYSAIGMLTALQLLSIESQLGVYLSGMVGRVLLLLVVCLPVMVANRRSHLGTRAGAGASQSPGTLRPGEIMT